MSDPNNPYQPAPQQPLTQPGQYGTVQDDAPTTAMPSGGNPTMQGAPTPAPASGAPSPGGSYGYAPQATPIYNAPYPPQTPPPANGNPYAPNPYPAGNPYQQYPPVEPPKKNRKTGIIIGISAAVVVVIVVVVLWATGVIGGGKSDTTVAANTEQPSATATTPSMGTDDSLGGSSSDPDTDSDDWDFTDEEQAQAEQCLTLSTVDERAECIGKITQKKYAGKFDVTTPSTGTSGSSSGSSTSGTSSAKTVEDYLDDAFGGKWTLEESGTDAFYFEFTAKGNSVTCNIVTASPEMAQAVAEQLAKGAADDGLQTIVQSFDSMAGSPGDVMMVASVTYNGQSYGSKTYLP